MTRRVRGRAARPHGRVRSRLRRRQQPAPPTAHRASRRVRQAARERSHRCCPSTASTSPGGGLMSRRGGWSSTTTPRRSTAAAEAARTRRRSASSTRSRRSHCRSATRTTSPSSPTTRGASPPRQPADPTADYDEILVVLDGTDCFYLEGFGPIKRPAAAKLIEMLRAAGGFCEAPAIAAVAHLRSSRRAAVRGRSSDAPVGTTCPPTAHRYGHRLGLRSDPGPARFGVGRGLGQATPGSNLPRRRSPRGPVQTGNDTRSHARSQLPRHRAR